MSIVNKYAVHPSPGHTALEIATGYGLAPGEYISVTGAAFPAGTAWHNYINLYYPEDGAYRPIKQELGDLGLREYLDFDIKKHRRKYGGRPIADQKG